MAVDVIIGLQRGDEGKGRFVDLAAPAYDVVARGNGGANAGHTIVPDGKSPIALHQIPSGIAYPNKLNVIGGGVYLDPVKLCAELKQLQAAEINISPENLRISMTAHLVMPHHIILDEQREQGSDAQGTTKSGIAFVAADKYLREGSRVEAIFDQVTLHERVYEGLKRVTEANEKTDAELNQIAQDWVSALDSLKPYIGDTVEIINQCIKDGKNILVEGAQAFGLDIDHGMYPFVTSSSTTVAGLLGGLGIAPKHVNKVTGVVKAVKSHVGGGPFVTEITDDILASQIRGEQGAVDSEYGATTKRPRRVGYLDIPELRSALQVNGVDEIVLSKLDHISRFGPTFQVATAYQCGSEVRQTAPSSATLLSQCQPIYSTFYSWGDIVNIRNYADLPPAALTFIEIFEKEVGTPITKIGVGPERQQVIEKKPS